MLHSIMGRCEMHRPILGQPGCCRDALIVSDKGLGIGDAGMIMFCMYKKFRMPLFIMTI